MRNFSLLKFLALLLMAVCSATLSMAQNVAKNVAKIGTTEYATLEEAVNSVAQGKKGYIYILADASFDKLSIDGKQIIINLQTHTVKGNSIDVNGVEGVDTYLKILDSKAKGLTVNKNDNYSVSYTASGTLELTGSITAYEGAKIKVESGKVVSTTNFALLAYGDVTGQSDVASSIEVAGGYVKAQEGCVSPRGRGAAATISGTAVLESLDNAAVMGNGTYNSNEKLGGTSITIMGKCWLIGRIQSDGYAACGIYHPQQGTLTIKYSSGIPNIVAVNGAGIVMRGGTLDYRAGNITATGDANFTGKVGDSRVVVGTSGIVYDRDCNYYDVANAKIAISDNSGVKKVVGAKSAIEVVNENNQAVDNVFDIQGGTFSSDVSAYVNTDGGRETFEHEGTYYVGKFKAQVEGGLKYETALTAINNAPAGSTVKLLKDCSESGRAPEVTKNVTLDLNGKNLTFSYITASKGGNLTIKDSGNGGTYTGTGANYSVLVKKGGVFNLESGTLTNSSTASGTSNVVVRVEGGTATTPAASTANIKGGKIESKGTPVFVRDPGATVNVSGGDLVGSGLACIAGNGSDGMGGTTINVSGGTLTAKPYDATSAACGIYHPNEGTLTITGGTINVTDGVGVLMRGGEMTMTGGEINATGDANRTGSVGDTNQKIGVSGVIFDRDANYPAVATTSISIDGKAKVNGAKEAVELINTNNVADAKSAFKLKGGTYNKDVSALLDANSVAEQKDGAYVVTTYYAQVGETKYATLQAAVDAVPEGGSGNIEVIADATFNELKIKDKTINLDLLKHTVKGNYIDVYNDKGQANLNIKDSSPDKALSVDKNNDYAVSYTNSGILEMTHIIGAYYGAGINVESGTIVSTNDMALSAIGDDTGQKDIKSYIKITGGYIKAKSYCACPEGRGASVTIEGNAVLESLDNAAVAGNGTNTATKKLGGTSISIGGPCWLIGRSQTEGDAACGIYHPQQGTLTLKNSSGIPNIVAVNGAGIVMRGGTLDYQAGNITATGDANFTGKIGDSSVEVGTCGIVYDRDCGYYDVANAKINISDNSEEKKVVGTKSAIQVINDKNQNIDGVFDIQGGNFSSDVSKYCAVGFTATPNSDGTYGISKVGDLSVMVAYDKSYENVAEGGTVDINMDTVNKIMVAKTEVANVNTTLTKTFANTGWNAFFVPFDFTLTAEMLNDFEFAKLYAVIAENNAPVVNFKTVAANEKISAYSPYLIKAKTVDSHSLNVGAVTYESNVGEPVYFDFTDKTYIFYPVMENTYIAAEKGYYLNSEKNSFVYNKNAGAYVPPLRFYMTIWDNKTEDYIVPTSGGASKVKFCVIGEGEATGITDIVGDAANASGKVYNLQGVLVGNTTEGLPKGVYIKNGRKVIVK